MKLEEAVVRLFESAEDLRSTRDDLIQVGKEMNEPERLHVLAAVKEIDIVRVTLLGQHELLDTSNIIRPQYLFDYYARRLEILEPTRDQLLLHVREIVAIGRNAQDPQAVRKMEQARVQVDSSIEIIDAIIGILKDRSLAEGKDRILH